MKRLLLATAAALALAVAAPLATAQYTTPPPATAPYTTPLPDDPLTPQDESLTTATQPAPPGTPEYPTAQTPGAPTTMQPYDTTTQAQTGTQQPTQAWDAQQQQQQALDAQQHQHQQPLDAQQQQQQHQQAWDAQQQQAQAWDAGPVSAATMASLQEHARDAGMDGLPMSAQAVCMPREITLTTRGAQLSADTRRQLINAADRASVCEVERVIVRSPTGRADAVRQTLVSHGFDAGAIEVQNTGAGGLEVEMNFAGIATSNEQYAQMFSPQQLAGLQPGVMQQGFQPGATQQGVQPGATQQGLQPGVTQPQGFQPGTATQPGMGTEAEGIWLGDPNAEIPTQPYYGPDGMSPTSGEPAASPELLDI